MLYSSPLKNKSNLIVILLAVVWLSGFLCSPVQAAKTIKLHHPGLDAPFNNPTGTMARVFTNLVETGSNGELRVTILANGVLGPDPEVVAQVKKGHIQSAIVEAVAMAELYPGLTVFETPFALPDAPTASAVLDGPFGRQMAADIRKATGLKVLGFGDSGGFVQFTAPRRDFITPEELQGKRMGVTRPEHARLLERLGALPVLLPPNELLPALQNDRIEGASGQISALVDARVGEAQNYLLLADALYSPVVWIMNEAFWADLSEDDKALVSRSARVAILAGNGLARAVESSDRGLPTLRATMRPLVLNPEERARLRDAALPALRAQLESAPKPEKATLNAPELLDLFLKQIDDTSKMLQAYDLEVPLAPPMAMPPVSAPAGEPDPSDDPAVPVEPAAPAVPAASDKPVAPIAPATQEHPPTP